MITEVGLYEKYKGFFWDRDSGKKIECDKGWFDLIDEICSKLKLLDSKKIPVFDLLKQKSGTLVVKFVKTGDDAFDVRMGRLAFDFSQQSNYICEICGSAGKMARSENGNRQILCDQHVKENDYSR